MIDTYRHKGLRRKLAEEVKGKGISDERIIQAIEKIPRHFFLDSSFVEFAYQDKPFPIGSGQTISQPYTVAFQTELLNILKGDKVLEIGTGSGYQACVLLELGAKVFSIERHHSLYVKTKNLLPKMGYNPRLFYGDGYKGLPAYAPFDKILITAAAPQIPAGLLQQLKTGGMMVIPVGAGGTQTMFRIIKRDENKYDQEDFGLFRFVPMLGSKE
ncbi:MAG: protein-L-isoaspartate(D-aspartate) O-methyltransferase [Bacteroidales bacterium]|jgi:protein-L-isoaspartate(D-aspartate) O-methyltransferase|nr:protein-L-isoaspartate(D-aspartate) O-methyltransferase [Bacteroidales bacterium]